MQKTYTVMDANNPENGRHLICIYTPEATSKRYAVYRKWYDKGWHRKKLNSFNDYGNMMLYAKLYMQS